MDLGDLEGALVELERRVTAKNPELVRRVAVTTLNVMRNHTPPNPGAHREKRESYNPSAEAVKKLRRRIQEEIVGGDQPATAVASKGSRAVALDVQGATGWGGYGFVVPRGSTRGRKVYYTDPEAVLRERKWKRRVNAYRAQRGSAAAGGVSFLFVTRAALLRAVQRRQKRAGALIGGWGHAMEALGGKMTGFRPSKERRGGRGVWRLYGGRIVFFAESDWGELKVGKRYRVEFDQYVNRWAAGNVKNVKMWYFKSIGLDGLAKKYENKKGKKRRR